MALSVQFNEKAAFASRQQVKHSRSLDQQFQRLSSGLRINNASDDSAGLSISTRMESQIRSHHRRMQNAQDAVSFSQTAESILGDSEKYLQRMRELAVQAASGTYNEDDRRSLQLEVDQLKSLLDTNDSSKFNQLSVFGEKRSFFISEDESRGLDVRVGPVAADNLGQLIRVTSNNTIDVTEALADGEFSIITHAGTFQIRGSHETDDQLSTSFRANSAIAKAGAINAATKDTGVVAIAEATVTASNKLNATDLNSNTYISINGQAISGFNMIENDTDGALQDAINAVHAETGVIATKNKDGALVLTAEDGRNIEINVEGAATLVGFQDQVIAGKLTLQSEDQFEASFTGDSNVSLGLLANQLIDDGSSTVTLLSNGKNDFVLNYSTTTPSDFITNGGVVNFSGTIDPGDAQTLIIGYNANTGELLLVDAGSNILDQTPFSGVDGTYTFTFGASTLNVELKNANFWDIQITFGVDDQVDALQIDAQSGAVVFGSGGAIMADKPLSVDTIDLSTQDGAEKAIFVLDYALKEVTEGRTKLGAAMNRLESTIRNLQSSSEHISSSKSRILDADFATETTLLAQTQIVQQASISLLAQANAAPSIALSLIA